MRKFMILVFVFILIFSSSVLAFSQEHGVTQDLETDDGGDKLIGQEIEIKSEALLLEGVTAHTTVQASRPSECNIIRQSDGFRMGGVTSTGATPYCDFSSEGIILAANTKYWVFANGTNVWYYKYGATSAYPISNSHVTWVQSVWALHDYSFITYYTNNVENIVAINVSIADLNKPIVVEIVNPDVNITGNRTINFLINASDQDADDLITNCDYRSDIDGFIGNDSSIAKGEFNLINISSSTFNQQFIYNFTCYGNDSTVASANWDIYVFNNASVIDWEDELLEDGHVINESSDVEYWFNCSDININYTLSAHIDLDGVFMNSVYDFENGVNQSLSFTTGDLAIGNRTVTLTCDDGFVNTTATKILIWDGIPPDIPLFGQAFPQENNLSFALNKSGVPINISCHDINLLWSVMINISINGSEVFGFYQEDLLVSNFTYDTPVNLSDALNGSALVNVVCFDSHTDENINPYYYDKDISEALLSYHTKDKVILIQGITSEGLVDLDTKYSGDRYNFIYDYSNINEGLKDGNGQFTYTFLVYSDKEIKKKSESDYKGHLIINEGEANWIDFNLLNDKDSKVNVKHLGENIWKVDVKTKLKRLEFNSHGQLNRADASASFYLGNPIDLVSPVENAISQSEGIAFNCSLQHFDTVDNITLLINDFVNETVDGTSNLTFLEETVNLAEGYYNWSCQGFDSEGVFVNFSEIRNFTVSPTFPVLNLTEPMPNLTNINVFVANNTLNFTASSIILDSCKYSINSAENISHTCNTSIDFNYTTGEHYNLRYCANDTVDRETCDETNFTNFLLTASIIQSLDTLSEGATNDINLFVNLTPRNATFTSDSVLFWNESIYNFNSKISIENQQAFLYGYSFETPNLSGTPDGNNVTYSFFYDINDVLNLSVNQSQTVYSVNIGDCETYSTILANYTLFDEETRTVDDIRNATIESSATISSLEGVLRWDYSTTTTSLNETNATLAICISDNFINFSNYSLDIVTRYESEDRVVEYNYIEPDLLSFNDIPFFINLYDLLEEDSTSFIIRFQDENYLPVEVATIDLLRFYVGSGIFLSVEHGKTNDQGQTRLHLVTEDVKYIFVIRKDGEVIYTSPEYLAFCQELPCQINLQQGVTNEGISDVGGVDNLVSELEFNKDTRTVTFTFATEDGTPANILLNVTLQNAYLNDTVCTESLSSSAGILSCTIPESYANTTYLMNAYKDFNLITEQTASLQPSTFDIFGFTGPIMAAFLFLTLVFIGAGDAVAMIIFGIIGIILASLLTLFNSGSIFGVGSSIIWLIVAASIIIYKISQKRRI